MTAPARIAAFRALQAIASNRMDLPSALAAGRSQLSNDRDRALAADIVTGTLRWQRSLDHLIAHTSRRPLHKLDEDIVIILRLSLYQLLHLDRVPAAAVVDDAVDAARGARKPSAAGFVNAVLRTTLRARHRLPLPPRPADPADREAALAYLGITHSHPEWLVARWLARYGFDATEAWVRFNNETPLLTLRTNRLKTSRVQLQASLSADSIDTRPTMYAPDGLEVTAGHPLRVPSGGAFVVQDEASQLVTLAVGARPGERVLDLCASPGGKTAAMAADMDDHGRIVACDVRARRMRLLQKTIQASGASSVRLVQVERHGALPFAVQFDRVLVDAPCSGLGTIRRDPDIRWRRSESQLSMFARDQLGLLARAADVVRPAGRLVYATCSSEPDENDAVVDAFLAARSDFHVVDLRGVPLLSSVVDGRGMLRTLPFEHHLEGFFAAALDRA